MRGLVVGLFLVLLVPAISLPTSGALPMGGGAIFAEDFDGEAVGWWNEPGWDATDNRAASGASMYFGDDKGTATPDDNDVAFCEAGVACVHELQSPAFTLPAGAPAHLYFWAYVDVVGDQALVVEVETRDDAGFQRHAVLEARVYPGWISHGDLSPWAGTEIRLVFRAWGGYFPGYVEGVYLDNVLVAEAFMETEATSSAAFEGPAVSFSYEGGPGGDMVIEALISGNWSADLQGFVAYRELPDGRSGMSWSVGGPWMGFGAGPNFENPEDSVAYFAAAEIDAHLLGVHAVDQDVVLTTLDSLTTGVLVQIRPELAEPGLHRYTIALIGSDDATSTVTIRTQSGERAASGVGGGRVVVRATPGDFPAHLSVVADNQIMIEQAELSALTSGPSLSQTLLRADVMEGRELVGPSGPLEPDSRGAYSATGGAWSVHVDRAAGETSLPWWNLFEVPAFPEPEPRPGPNPVLDITASSAIEDSGLRYRPWRVWLSLGCQVNAGLVATDGNCELFPLISTFDTAVIPVHAGLRRVAASVAPDAEALFGPRASAYEGLGRCLETEGPTALTTTECGAGDFDVLVAESDDPIITGTHNLSVTIEMEAPGIGALHIVVVRLDLVYAPS